MEANERSPLLQINSHNNNGKQLSVFFAIICIVDVFGIFPIITLPKAIISCGYYGILLVVLICSIQIYTASLLGRCWNLAEKLYPDIKMKYRYPYSALAEITYGKYLSSFINILLNFTIFCAGIPNLVVASHNLELFSQRVSNDTFQMSFCYWILILGIAICPILWLGSPKDMKTLCSISVITVITVFLLTCNSMLFIDSSQDTATESINFDSNLDFWKRILITYGIITFQFDVHPIILTIQMDMKKRNKLPLAVLGGFVISLIMCAGTTSISAFKYGMTIKPNILDMLPTSIVVNIATLLVAIQLCLTSTVGNNALYQHIENYLNISPEFNWRRCLTRTICMILAIIIAESVPRFDLVMSLIGGAFVAPLVFLFPPLFYMKMIYLYRQSKSDMMDNVIISKYNNSSSTSDANSNGIDLIKYYERKFRSEFQSDNDNKCTKLLCNGFVEMVICGVIVLLAIGAICFTTYFNVTYSLLSYANFTKPCIYNITYAIL